MLVKIVIDQSAADEGQKSLGECGASRCAGCPGAVAINRVLATPWLASVGFASVALHVGFTGDAQTRIEGNHSYLLSSPDKLRHAIRLFDDAKTPEVLVTIPIEFNLDIPEKCLKQEIIDAQTSSH